jgi:hypothetical protein
MRAMDGLCAFGHGVQGRRLNEEVKRLLHPVGSAAAEKYVKNFSIVTECGFGRWPPETIPELLRIHAAAAE